MTPTKIQKGKKVNVAMVEMRIDVTFAILKEIMNMMLLSRNENLNENFNKVI